MSEAKKPQPEKPKSPPPQVERPKETAKEIGGRKGPEPTRYGDWEVNGIVSDF